jgi:hypothetical protein
MKEDVKMKENIATEPMGTMPQVGAMQQMQAAPGVSPIQPNPMGVMPSMMNPMPMMCCPFLMNMQCPMTYGQNVMGTSMMGNPMFPGVSPISGNVSPVMGAANSSMDPMYGMGMTPAMSRYYPMGGM